MSAANQNANIAAMNNANSLKSAIAAIEVKNAASQSIDEKRRLPKLKAKLNGLPKNGDSAASNKGAAAPKPIVANEVGKKTAVNVTSVGKVSAVKADAAKALAGLDDNLTVYVAAPVAGGRRTRRHRSRRHRSRRHR